MIAKLESQRFHLVFHFPSVECRGFHIHSFHSHSVHSHSFQSRSFQFHSCLVQCFYFQDLSFVMHNVRCLTKFTQKFGCLAKLIEREWFLRDL